jgi:TRAP-type C4-dicarboxylate transport system permease small subunit
MPRLLAGLSDRLNQAAQWALCAVGMGMALTIALQVFFRYALNQSLFWSEELGRMLLVWLTFLGASVAYKRGAHLGVDVVAARLTGRAARIMRVAMLGVSLFFFLVMSVWGVKFFLFIQAQQTTTLGFSKQVPFVMVPVGGMLMSLHALSFLMHELFGDKP